jgi:hypothetical protein
MLNQIYLKIRSQCAFKIYSVEQTCLYVMQWKVAMSHGK